MNWDGTYMKHHDSNGEYYYSFVMDSKSACPVLHAN